MLPAGEVYHCDALRLLQCLDGGSVGAVVTDPPFFISTGRPPSGEPHWGEFDDPWSKAGDMETCFAEVRPVVDEIARVLRVGGALAVMGQGLCRSVWDLSARAAGLNWMSELTILWNTGKPRGRNFGSLHTSVSWYSKPGAKHTFNSGEKRSIYSNVLVCKKVSTTVRNHPSEKPVGLTNFLVSLLTEESDLIVDPFCGSGSTLVSAAMLSRPWMGSDLDRGYCSVAKSRADNHELEDVDPVHLWINGRQVEV